MATSVDNLASELAEAMAEYSDEVMDHVKGAVRETARACVKELRATSPKRAGKHKSAGSYAKGWRARAAYDGRFDIRIEVYNKTDYQLTHLLEHGHANAKGGGRTPAHPHIAAAEANAVELLGKKVELAIDGSGMKGR